MGLIFEKTISGTSPDLKFVKIRKKLAKCLVDLNIYLYFLYGNQQGITIFYSNPKLYKKALLLKNIFLSNNLDVKLLTFYNSEYDIQIGLTNLQLKDNKFNYKDFNKSLYKFIAIIKNSK